MLWNCGISRPSDQMAGLMVPFAMLAWEAGVKHGLCVLQVCCFPQRKTRFSYVHSTQWFPAMELAQEVVLRGQAGRL